MKSSLIALREAERKDAVEIMQRALQASVARLHGGRGEEAQLALKREPPLENTVEILMLAAGAWKKFGREKQSRAAAQLAEMLAAKLKRNKRLGGERERMEGHEHRLERIKQLEAELHELQQAIKGRVARLRELRRNQERE